MAAAQTDNAGERCEIGPNQWWRCRWSWRSRRSCSCHWTVLRCHWPPQRCCQNPSCPQSHRAAAPPVVKVHTACGGKQQNMRWAPPLEDYSSISHSFADLAQRVRSIHCASIIFWTPTRQDKELCCKKKQNKMRRVWESTHTHTHTCGLVRYLQL